MKTLKTLVLSGNPRVRCAIWTNPNAYMKFHLTKHEDKTFHGPWVELWDRETQELIGEPTPQILLIPGSPLMSDPGNGWSVYTGPLDPADVTPKDKQDG